MSSILLSLLTVFCGDVPTVEALAELERQARATIQSGELEMEVRRRVAPNDAADEAERVIATYHVWFDAENLRSDTTSSINPAVADSGISRKVLTGDHFLTHMANLPNGQRVGARVDHGPVLKTLVEERKVMIFDPRDWGRVNMPTGMVHNVRWHPQWPEALPKSVQQITEERIEQGLCWKITAKNSETGYENQRWISPEKGHRTVRLRTSANVAGDRMLDELDVTLEAFDNPACWFPRSVAFRRTVNDRCVIRENAVATALRINQPIAPETFTFAGFDLPEGLPIYEYPPHPKGTRIWNGREMAVPPSRRADNPLVPTPGKRDAVLWIVAINLAVLGCVLLGVYRWRRRSSANTPR
jgi:hypothetical protein